MVSSLPLSISSRARFQPDLAGSHDDDVHLRVGLLANRARRACSIAICVGQTVSRPCSSYHAARAGSSTRTTTRGDVEAPLRDLGDHEVRVVAVGRGDEGVGAVDAGLEQRVDLERGARR